ncbi:MAG: aminotransferase class I/II-fold pyridoxal phosphate-dependent enzyme [Desulfovibrionaceae bacterium]
MTQRIFLSPPHMGGAELDLVREAFASNYIAPAGPHIDAFEREMEDYLAAGAPARPHCVAVSSGTAAIHIALRLCGVDRGDAVPCQDLTFMGSAGPITYQQARPVFFDSEPATWNMDPDLVEAWLAARAKAGALPKALILVHIFGMCADVARLAALCGQYGVTLVEDAAESLGATVDGRQTGTFGRFGILSFNGNKIITTSGGGMLVCAREEDARQARFLATQARDPAPHYEHTQVGYNYRMSNVCAAIGRGQLMVLPERVAKKRAVYDMYRTRLAPLGDRIGFMPEGVGRGNRWLTCVRFLPGEPDATRGEALREQMRLALEAANIESRPIWKPMHMQPVFAACEYVGADTGRDIFLRGLCLPSGTALTEEDMDRICGIIRTIVGE